MLSLINRCRLRSQNPKQIIHFALRYSSKCLKCSPWNDTTDSKRNIMAEAVETAYAQQSPLVSKVELPHLIVNSFARHQDTFSYFNIENQTSNW